MTTIKKVHCHSQEYWSVARATCQCGAAFSRKSVDGQQLQMRAAGHVDVLHVRCDSCGAEAELEFDISSFFGKPDIASFQRLLGDREQLWGIYVWHELRMEGVLKYLSELAASGDVDAIEYLIEAARHFSHEAREQSKPASS